MPEKIKTGNQEACLPVDEGYTPLKFEWGWCKLCERPFVRCPKCGNNSCNAGYGQVDGKTCDVCPLAYQYQDLASEAGKEPTKEECRYTAGEDKDILDGLEKVEF